MENIEDKSSPLNNFYTQLLNTDIRSMMMIYNERSKVKVTTVCNIVSISPTKIQILETFYVPVCFILYLYLHFSHAGYCQARRFNINKLYENPMMDLFPSSSTITFTDLMGFSRLTIMME